MGSPKTPSVPDPNKSYLQGIQANLKYAPQVANAEFSLRAQYDDQSVQQSLDRQQQFAPQAINLYRSELSQISPWSQDILQQTGEQISSDLAQGYNLTSDETRQAQQQARAQEAASGNILGNAAVGTEAISVGNASFSLYQQRLTNAGSFLSYDKELQQTASTRLLTLGATSPDRSFNYVDSSAGTAAQSLLNQTYQADLSFAQNFNANNYLSPWQRMLQGAYIGAREGWSGGGYAGFVGAAYGALGGALGGSFQGLINAPDYQANVQYSGDALYGNPNAYASAGGFAGSVGAQTALTFG